MVLSSVFLDISTVPILVDVAPSKATIRTFRPIDGLTSAIREFEKGAGLPAVMDVVEDVLLVDVADGAVGLVRERIGLAGRDVVTDVFRRR